MLAVEEPPSPWYQPTQHVETAAERIMRELIEDLAWSGDGE